MIDFSDTDSKGYIEIHRIYLERSQQKKGYGQKIIYDVLNFTGAKGFELYPLDFAPWIKMGMVFDGDYVTISKEDFLINNSGKL
jgi:GNAT superfamily N-acetyltransferase